MIRLEIVNKKGKMIPLSTRRKAQIVDILDDYSASGAKNLVMGIQLADDALVLAIDERDKVVGYGHVLASGQSVEFVGARVACGHRRQGILTRMVDRVILHARGLNAKEVVLTTGRDAPQNDMYRRKGFEPTYYGGDLKMRLKL